MCITIKCENSVHSSSMPNDAYGAHPMGFVANKVDHGFYYGGDAALTLERLLIPLYTRIDVAILPISDNFTMGVKYAVEASKKNT